MRATPRPFAGWDEYATGVTPVGSAEARLRIDTAVVTPTELSSEATGAAVIVAIGVDCPAVICGVTTPCGNVAVEINRSVLSTRCSGSKFGIVRRPSAERSPVTDLASSMNRRVSAPVTRNATTVI